jgi:hypothetical protein
MIDIAPLHAPTQAGFCEFALKTINGETRHTIAIVVTLLFALVNHLFSVNYAEGHHQRLESKPRRSTEHNKKVKNI